MKRFILVLCGWLLMLLPHLTIASTAPEVSLRLVDGTYRPGDVLELHAQMRGADYAEFELHVPSNAQLHFVANTREPVSYVDGEYLQRVLLLLQPMSAGAFELAGITATINQDGVSTDVALPPVLFTVASYAAEDVSEAVAELGANEFAATGSSGIKRVLIWGLFVVLMIVWLRLKVANSKPVESVEIKAGLSDLIATLEAGESGTALMEQLLARSDLSLSPTLREQLEAAAYANRLNTDELLTLLRQEVTR